MAKLNPSQRAHVKERATTAGVRSGIVSAAGAATRTKHVGSTSVIGLAGAAIGSSVAAAHQTYRYKRINRKVSQGKPVNVTASEAMSMLHSAPKPMTHARTGGHQSRQPVKTGGRVGHR